MKVLVFTLNGNRYGINSQAVLEVVRAVKVSPLPSLPRSIAGVFDLRGQVVPLIDVRRRFGLPSGSISPSDHFIVVEMDDRLIALHVDEALELQDVEPAALEAVNEVVIGDNYIVGALSLDDGMVVIYDLPAFLSRSEAMEVDAALSR